MHLQTDRSLNTQFLSYPDNHRYRVDSTGDENIHFMNLSNVYVNRRWNDDMGE